MPTGPDWMPEEELAQLAKHLEDPTPSKRDEAKLAEQIFRDHVGLAAQVVTDIMLTSESEKMRFQAAKYVTERVLGRAGDVPVAGAQDAWTDLFGSVLREPTAEERKTGARVSRI